jgi:hypothetical protein
MEKVQTYRPWYNLKKVEYDSSTKTTYTWYHENYSAADTDETGVLKKQVNTVNGTVTTDVFQLRKGSWTARATGW